METAQLFSQKRTSTVEAAADGSDTYVQHAGDRLIIETINFPQHQYSAELLTQSAECRLDLCGAFGAQHLFGRRIAGVGGIGACAAGSLVDRDFGAGGASSVDSCIEGDTVQPGIKRAIATERAEFEQGLDKGVLYDIFCFFTLPDDMHDAGKESILIAAHELPEGGGIALQGLLDQLNFVGHVASESVANKNVPARMERHDSPKEGRSLASAGAAPSLELGVWLDPAVLIFLPIPQVVKPVRRFEAFLLFSFIVRLHCSASLFSASAVEDLSLS